MTCIHCAILVGLLLLLVAPFLLLLLYVLIGAAVMTWLDAPERYNGALMAWEKTAPVSGMGLMAWPWMLREFRQCKELLK